MAPHSNSRSFYDLADELGLVVWQELPLSSSGIDNTPPADDEIATALARIARDYVRRVAHHPSLVLWGGGNELTSGSAPFQPDAPLTDAHPALAAAKVAFAEHDPGRRFVATSPTGPTIWADPAHYGEGIHHDVHGPWESDDTFEAWQRLLGRRRFFAAQRGRDEWRELRSTSWSATG